MYFTPALSAASRAACAHGTVSRNHLCLCDPPPDHTADEEFTTVVDPSVTGHVDVLRILPSFEVPLPNVQGKFRSEVNEVISSSISAVAAPGTAGTDETFLRAIVRKGAGKLGIYVLPTPSVDFFSGFFRECLSG